MEGEIQYIYCYQKIDELTLFHLQIRVIISREFLYGMLHFGCTVNLGMPFLPIFLRFDPLLQDILCLGTKVSSRSLSKFCNSHKKKLYHGI